MVCEHISDAVKGELQSPNYPNAYDNDVRCRYRLRPAGRNFCRVLLQIRDFDIRSNGNCDEDYLYMDGQRWCNSNLRETESKFAFIKIIAQTI